MPGDDFLSAEREAFRDQCSHEIATPGGAHTSTSLLWLEAKLPDGRSARDYDIAIDPAGKVLINGVDVRALIPRDL
jgi:hypothetical protein